MTVIARATVKLDHTHNAVASVVSDFTSPNSDHYQTRQLKQALRHDLTACIQNKLNELLKYNFFAQDYCAIEVLDNKTITIISSRLDDKSEAGSIWHYLTGKENMPTSIIIEEGSLSEGIKKAIEITADKIKSHCQWILDRETKTSSKKAPTNKVLSTIPIKAKDINPLEKAFKALIESINQIFVVKIYQAKGADLAALALFVFIILAAAITIFAPHSAFAHFVSLGNIYSHPVFGALNITVGLGIAAQSIKNIQKAIKNKNKEELALAIVSLFFSFAIMATGATAVANFKNDYLLKTLFTVCAGFSFSVGVYNLIQTQLFRKKLNAAKLKDFLKDQIEIKQLEYKALRSKIEALKLEEVKKELQKHLSKQEYNEIIKAQKTQKELQDLLFNLELQIIQKRKIAKLERILRSELTKKALEFLYSSDTTNEELEKEIRKELNRRCIADGFRIFATSLSIGAFGFNTLAKHNTIHLSSENLQNLIYYSTLLISKLSGFWLNYIPSWRNVPAEEKKDEETQKPKTMFEHMQKRAQNMPITAPVLA